MAPLSTRRHVMALGAAACGASVIAAPLAAAAAPAAQLIDRRWTVHGAAAEPDHGAWDRIMARHRQVGGDGIARFDYARADAAAVQAYIGALATVDPAKLGEKAGFAYWANLYNALAVSVVLGAYPVKSIRDIGGGLFSRGPWRDKRVRVAGVALSLDDIEHGILRPVWRDPRVHYALNCAALGCPDLSPRAFTAARLDKMLDSAAREFVNHPRGVAIEDGALAVSSIYHWFKADFGGTDAGVIAHLSRHAGSALRAKLQGRARLDSHRYDWRLNTV